MFDRSHPALITTVAVLLATALSTPATADTRIGTDRERPGAVDRVVQETAAPLPTGKAYGAVENNFITRWSTSYDGAVGTLDDDLIGEAAVVPICTGDRPGDDPAALALYSTDSAFLDGRIYSNWYDTPGTNFDIVRYYVTQVESLTDRDVMLMVGADDGIRVWVNGDEVLRQDAPAEYVEGSLQVPVSLVEGWNLLLVKVYYPQLGPQGDPDHEYRYWSLRFTETDGRSPVLDVYQSYDGWCSPTQEYTAWSFALGAADTAGALGSQWQSELRVTNPYYHNLRAVVQYWSTRNASGTPDGERVLRLDPFESVIFDNVVRELTGTADSGSGMVAIGGIRYEDITTSDVARLITSNVGAADGGTFGTQMPFEYLYRGYSCCSQQLYGLKNGPDNRTNILVAPAPFVPDELTVTISLWDPVSGTTASGEFSGRGAFQINDVFGRVGMGGTVTDTAIAHVTYSASASRPYWRMVASINDNVTSDPTLVVRAPSGVPTPFQ